MEVSKQLGEGHNANEREGGLGPSRVAETVGISCDTRLDGVFERVESGLHCLQVTDGEDAMYIFWLWEWQHVLVEGARDPEKLFLLSVSQRRHEIVLLALEDEIFRFQL